MTGRYLVNWPAPTVSVGGVLAVGGPGCYAGRTERVAYSSSPTAGHTDPVPINDEQELRDRLRSMYPAGTRLGGECAVVEVRDPPGEVVLLVRWERDPRLYGIPIPLGDTSRDFYYTDYPVASAEEWLDSVGLGLMIHMDTGVSGRCSPYGR